MLGLLNTGEIKGLAHITGGGFTDNIPRVFPKGLGASIKANSWEIPPIFKWIQEVSQFKLIMVSQLKKARNILDSFYLSLTLQDISAETMYYI